MSFIEVPEAAEKDHALIPVVGADALHLVQQKSLVERDNSHFQLLLDRLEGLVPNHNIVLL
jgi:hypothetical protein